MWHKRKPLYKHIHKSMFLLCVLSVFLPLCLYSVTRSLPISWSACLSSTFSYLCFAVCKPRLDTLSSPDHLLILVYPIQPCLESSYPGSLSGFPSSGCRSAFCTLSGFILQMSSVSGLYYATALFYLSPNCLFIDFCKIRSLVLNLTPSSKSE